MPSLPSFVELMATLGLQQGEPVPVVERSPSPPPSSSPGSPSTETSNRSSSSPSLRVITSQPRSSRFSPYSHAASFTRRRGSLSSVSSSDFESSPLSATFFIPRSRRYPNKLTVNTYGSSSDLNADTPISTYVRRKTPGASPTSPTFSSDSGYESSEPIAMPFSIPSLPVLLPNSASSESFFNTNTHTDDDAEIGDRGRSSPIGGKPGINYYRFIRRRTGTRISTPPGSAQLKSHYSRRKQTSELPA